MTETELTTNDMVNLLRFLGNENEWTYQPNHDESNAIQSFVQAKTLAPPPRVAPKEDLFYSSSPFVSMMKQQRQSICCVSPSLEEIDEDAVLPDVEYRENIISNNIDSSNKGLLPLDVVELMTSELIDYDRFASSYPDEPKSADLQDRIHFHPDDDNDLLSLRHSKRIERNAVEDSLSRDDDRMESSSPKTNKRARKNRIPSSAKKPRKTRDNAAPGPLRALSAYNFFFRDERDLILNNKEHDFSPEKEDALLQGHWNRDRSEKRIHCKTHGKLSFTDLSKEASRRWKALPGPQRDFYRGVAQRDWKRYEKELAALSQD